MARIMKVRTIPRGYVKMDGLKGFVHDNNGKAPAEWFMRLYALFGNPQDGGMWSYLLRHDNILLKVTATDRDTLDYDVWVSPGFVQEAQRKRTKVMNVIARRLNENGVVFIGDSLYYAVRKKNEELLARNIQTDSEVRDRMDKELTAEEKEILYGDLSQFMKEPKQIIQSTITEIFE